MTAARSLAQQARQDRERRQRQAEIQPINFRLLAQRARRNREHGPIARQPLPPQLLGTVSLRHRLSRCDITCRFCGANH